MAGSMSCSRSEMFTEGGLHHAVRVVEAESFTEDSPEPHHLYTFRRKGPSAMKENIMIPIKIERVKLWTRRMLEVTSWLICFGLLAASVVVATCAVLAWLVSGYEIIFALGFGGSLLLGLTGVWHLLHQIGRAANQLRHETSVIE